MIPSSRSCFVLPFRQAWKLCSLYKSTSTTSFNSRGIHILPTISEMRSYRKEVESVAFIPTMGALHAGHLELVRKGLTEHKTTVVSIFVNPTQFGVGEDLDKYPRTFEKDVKLLKDMGVDCVFAPNQDIMYPAGGLCHVEPSRFSTILEGIARPQFFRGVATVVCKLFNIVQPDSAYFGQKDISQCILIRSMVHDLNMPVEVKVCPTMRESDGLAMSSRNVYLSPNERKAASILYEALQEAKAVCEKSIQFGLDVDVKRKDVINTALEVLSREPLVSQVEYVSFASHTDMTELDSLQQTDGALISSSTSTNESCGAVISAAIRLGKVRLIDNVLVGSAKFDILAFLE